MLNLREPLKTGSILVHQESPLRPSFFAEARNHS